MATTPTSTARTPSVEAILDALRRRPGATAAELAEAAGVGRSTAGKALAALEAQGRAGRQRGTPDGGKATPDRWTLALTPDQARPEPPAATEGAADKPATETVVAAPNGDVVPPASGTGQAGEATMAASRPGTDADQPADASIGSGTRLRPGALRRLVRAWLAERPGQAFSPTRIGKELGRSAGAVGNALATMTDRGEVVQTSHKPRRYAIAEAGGQADAAR